MLEHGKPRHRKLFKALVEDLRTLPAYDAMRKHFPADQDLESDFRAYLHGPMKR